MPSSSARAALLASMMFAGLAMLQSARAGTESVLHSFANADGENPRSRLVQDTAGNFYGTTEFGGAVGYGTVFKLSPSGVESVLYAFTGGADGGYPVAGLVLDSRGNLYGVAQAYGANNAGVVFEIPPGGAEIVLHAFDVTDGEYPAAALLLDKHGNLYGTTVEGGAGGFGTVYKLAPNNTETVLYSFRGGSDGAYPYAKLFLDTKNDLYGTTFAGGGTNYGTVFKLGPKGETILHTFAGGADGQFPLSAITQDAQKNLYGTTQQGGTYTYGTVFKISPSGQESVLHAFGAAGDGIYPQAGLAPDQNGNFVSPTETGGSLGTGGYGTVFTITPAGVETVLHDFTYGDGAYPAAGVLLDKLGNIYGTTLYGGTSGNGTVFKLTP